jgi:hypothetical protein
MVCCCSLQVWAYIRRMRSGLPLHCSRIFKTFRTFDDASTFIGFVCLAVESFTLTATASGSCVTSETLVAVKVAMLLPRDVTSCGLVGTYRRFGGTYCLYLQNSDICQQIFMACPPVRPASAFIWHVNYCAVGFQKDLDHKLVKAVRRLSTIFRVTSERVQAVGLAPYHVTLAPL